MLGWILYEYVNSYEFLKKLELLQNIILYENLVLNLVLTHSECIDTTLSCSWQRI